MASVIHFLQLGAILLALDTKKKISQNGSEKKSRDKDKSR